MTPAKAALHLLKAEISVIPVKPDGSKAPAIQSWKRFQSERMAPDEAVLAFAGDVGTAIIGGVVSGGLEIIDAEAGASIAELLELIEETVPGVLATLPQVRTPSGGLHIYLRCSAIEGNQKLARDADGKVLIETRGEGGYVLAPSSPGACHPTGGTYDLLPGGARITATPTVSADVRAAILDCCRSFNTWVKPEPAAPAPSTPLHPTGGRPGDDFNARADVLPMLEAAGWHISSRHGDEYHLTRPDKPAGTSAVWHADSRLFFVFSTNAYPFESDTPYSPFGVLSTLSHGGDFKAAARALAADGYGDTPKQRRSHGGALPNPDPDTEPDAAPRPKLVTADDAAPPWQGGYLTTEKGSKIACFANAVTMLTIDRAWQGVLAYNVFAERVVALDTPPFADAIPPEWGDQQDRLTCDWMQRRGLKVSIELAGKAVQTVARNLSFNPVLDYLDALTWDEQPRVATWAETYLGAPGDPYTQAVAKRWLISAVARINEPGCQADHVLILEGSQGIGKSTAARILGAGWFSDDLDEIKSKDAKQQAHSAWIIELSELDSLSRSETGAIKAFVSRSTDQFRLPYERHVVAIPRQCVFIGTVNHGNYLRDETGGRRFWPVRCEHVDAGGLARDRDQLWAEAVALYRGGVKWWLETASLTALAAEQQSERYDGDVWEELVAPWLAAPIARTGGLYDHHATMTSNSESVTVADVLIHCIGKRQDQWTQGEKNRVARIMQSLGWERFRQRTKTGLEWRYRPASGA